MADEASPWSDSHDAPILMAGVGITVAAGEPITGGLDHHIKAWYAQRPQDGPSSRSSVRWGTLETTCPQRKLPS